MLLLTFLVPAVRELDGRRLVSRVSGRPAIEKRMRRLLLAMVRFSKHRAYNAKDRAWSARAIDALTDLLRAGADNSSTLDQKETCGNPFL